MRIPRLLWLAVIPLAGCAATPSYDRRQNLKYDAGSVPFGRFDLYAPRQRDLKVALPAIVGVHGGAWMSGDKGDIEDFAELACARGYAVLAPNYRLTADGPARKGSKWPAQLEDCQAALRYFRENASALGIDPERIGAFGVSAGGHLATMLALRDDPKANDNRKGRVVCTVAADGEHDMTLEPDRIMASGAFILTAALGHAPPWSDDELRDISTVTFARKDASVLVFHVTEDANVLVVNADKLHAALAAKGADVKIVKLPGHDHGHGWKAATPAIFEFFDARLK